MATARDRSWHVKLRRAEEHFVEFEREARRYLDSHPYEVRRVHQGEPKVEHWCYVLRVTQQPDQRLAAIAGDVLHNVRSALDHIFCAMLPRRRRRKRNAHFPVIRTAFAINDDGAILVRDDEEGKRFHGAVEGLEANAIATLCELQPGVASTPKYHPLSVLSGLENLDKHRDLIPLIFGIGNAHAFTMCSTDVRRAICPPFCEDGTVIDRFGVKRAPESEVRVELRGTPEIFIQRAVEGKHGSAAQLLRILVEDVPREVIPPLEPFARP